MYSAYAGIGSRKAPKDICDKFTVIGKELAKTGIILRSGHADGADIAFEKGCDKVPFGRKEIYIPWQGFNGSESNLFQIPNKAYDIARKFHPGFDELRAGSQKLLARDAMQVLGQNLDDKVDFIVCWTENGELRGGTAQALRIAKEFNIPVYNFGNPEDEELFFRKIINPKH